MPKILNLSTMSAKYLVDFLAQPGWVEKGHLDVYQSGELLAEVLPRFEDPPEVAPATTAAPVAADAPAEPAKPAIIYVKMLESPVPPVCQANGEADWSKMTKDQADAFRKAVTEHNKKFLAWCRAPLPRSITLTDPQVDICQRVLKFYSPRPQADKDKDKEKQQAPRPEIPNNEFSYQLLKQLGLSST